MRDRSEVFFVRTDFERLEAEAPSVNGPQGDMPFLRIEPVFLHTARRLLLQLHHWGDSSRWGSYSGKHRSETQESFTGEAFPPAVSFL